MNGIINRGSGRARLIDGNGNEFLFLPNGNGKITPYHADGTEGILITGVQKKTGKDGVDSYTNTLQTLDFDHHKLHIGDHYFVDNYKDLAINNVLDLQITTPDTTKWSNFTFSIETEAETLWQVWEGVTINVAGTTEPVFNNNRNSPNTSGLVIANIVKQGNSF